VGWKFRAKVPDIHIELEVKRSPIHGKGLFATEWIWPGAYVGRYAGPRVEEDGRYVLWIQGPDNTEYGVKGINELRYINHSPEPNVEFEGVELFAMHGIAPGEEILLHYGEDWEE
jgi:uncharacterized protein